jgi:hypothetical protein
VEGSQARQHLENLSHPDESIRHKATLALGGCGRKQGDWAPDLIAGVRSGGPTVRFWAAIALGRVATDPEQAVPPLVGLLSDPDAFGNRQVAADALAKIGRPAAREAVPALARVLATDDNHFVRGKVVRALRDLAIWNEDAVSALSSALDDPDESVRGAAVLQLSLLRVRGRRAVPALERFADRKEEPEELRSQAARAVEMILSGAPAFRYDEPYHSISEAASKAVFADKGAPDEIGRRLDQEDYEGAFELLTTAIEDAQESIVWLDIFQAGRELDRTDARRYYERYLESSGTGGLWREIEDVIRSTCTVPDGMRRIIRYCSRAEPNPRWKLFDDLAIDEDLLRLQGWLEAVFAEQPPPESVPGLWFGLTGVERGGESSFDLHLSGGYPDDEEPHDRVIGGSWQPRMEYADSIVLDQIHKIAHSEDMDDAEYQLALSYGGLVVRWLATTLSPEVLLVGAPERVLAVGFDDGDSLGIGTLRPDGLDFSN